MDTKNYLTQTKDIYLSSYIANNNISCELENNVKSSCVLSVIALTENEYNTLTAFDDKTLYLLTED